MSAADNYIPKATVEELACSVNANFLLSFDWLKYYGIMMRQAQNSEQSKKAVVKAAHRILEDLGEVENG